MHWGKNMNKTRITLYSRVYTISYSKTIEEENSSGLITLNDLT